jgi:glyoxylase-like metal-dependent hydrolase (beta-lactamase superfamily II)
MPIANQTSPSLSILPFASSEPGAWSNSYLISGKSEAVLFDVFMLRSDAAQIADGIAKTGKTLSTVMISHAHPDHFMGLEVIRDHFPQARVVSTANVVADIKADGPWMFSMLQNKLGAQGPTNLVIPEVLTEPLLSVDGIQLEVAEFGEGEARHIAAVHIPEMKALLAADLVYNQAHLYLQERHLESWLARLDELESFAKGRVQKFHPGHGKAAGLELIEQTRGYLRDFAEAVKSGDASTAEQRVLAKYPDYHVKQFLTVFSIPAYFPAPDMKATA